jgi:soluble lytic murein transglycosylase-like protein
VSNLHIVKAPTKRVPNWAKSYPWIVVSKYAKKYHVDTNLLIALMGVESGGRAWVSRFEPHIKKYYSPNKFAQYNNQTLSTEKIQQASSFGYMQILGRTARLLGFQEPLGNLFNPDVNIEYACKLIKDIRLRYRHEEDIIAAYNAGAARIDNGRYVNQEYVDKVNSRLEELRL